MDVHSVGFLENWGFGDFQCLKSNPNEPQQPIETSQLAHSCCPHCQLSEYQIVGLATNVDFLKRLVRSPAFVEADMDTGLIERNQGVLFPPPQPASNAVLILAAISLLKQKQSC